MFDIFLIIEESLMTNGYCSTRLFIPWWGGGVMVQGRITRAVGAGGPMAQSPQGFKP
jgi:hypothetical protein